MNGATLLTGPSIDMLAHLQWPSDEARTWVGELVRRADDEPRILAIVLYGSSVRGIAAPGDIDLLIVREGGQQMGDIPLDVDLRTYERTELDAQIASGDEVLGWALRFGLTVFERDRFWSRLAARWTGHLPLPSAQTAEERAERALRAANGLREGGDAEAAGEVMLTAVTQRARARLLRAGIFPLSRPELPGQLLSIGEYALAADLDRLRQHMNGVPTPAEAR